MIQHKGVPAIGDGQVGHYGVAGVVLVFNLRNRHRFICNGLGVDSKCLPGRTCEVVTILICGNDGQGFSRIHVVVVRHSIVCSREQFLTVGGIRHLRFWLLCRARVGLCSNLSNHTVFQMLLLDQEHEGTGASVTAPFLCRGSDHIQACGGDIVPKNLSGIVGCARRYSAVSGEGLVGVGQCVGICIQRRAVRCHRDVPVHLFAVGGHRRGVLPIHCQDQAIPAGGRQQRIEQGEAAAVGARYLYRKLVGTYLCKGNCRPIDFCPVFRSFCNGDGNLSGVHVMPSLTGDVVVHLDCGMVGFLIVIETVVPVQGSGQAAAIHRRDGEVLRHCPGVIACTGNLNPTTAVGKRFIAAGTNGYVRTVGNGIVRSLGQAGVPIHDKLALRGDLLTGVSVGLCNAGDHIFRNLLGGYGDGLGASNGCIPIRLDLEVDGQGAVLHIGDHGRIG